MPRRLTLVIHALHGGGAERAVAMTANLWADAGHDVTVITLDSTASDVFPLQAGIARVGLDVMRPSATPLQAVLNNFQRIHKLRHAIYASSPDVVISFTDKTNVLTLLACKRLRIPVIATERTDPRHHAIGRIWSMLRRRYYPRAAALVVQTQAVADVMRPMLQHRPVVVIPNAVEPPRETPPALGKNNDDIASADVEASQQRIIGIGRLSPEKGFASLIVAFANIAEKHSQWKLTIYGEGPQRPDLQELILSLGLQNHVTLPGWVPNVVAELNQSQVFVLPSAYEGFPNALLEAMACGLACISYDCESGPREIIRHEVDGFLVPAGDVTALSQALDQLLSNEALCRQLGERAREVVQRFGVQEYLRRWEEVLTLVQA